jgi:3',5'-nucleoside bisphosphate phosphatase
VIDLHLHTIASDGRSTPEALVSAAARARLHTIAVTDHDTVAALDRTAAACAAAGIRWVAGIEITALLEGVDLHILGYFIDHRSPRLTAFLAEQVEDRRRRVREMIEKLGALGVHVDADVVLGEHGGLDARWIGRPTLARALVRAGHVRGPREAFDRYLAEEGAAWVPRRAPAPEAVIALVHGAGGLASLAHPGTLGRDEWIEPLAAAGLDAIEVFYPEHSPELTTHYRVLAERCGIGLTGGSDFHGDTSHGPARPGSTTLPDEEFDRLCRRLDARTAPGPATRPAAGAAAGPIPGNPEEPR